MISAITTTFNPDIALLRDQLRSLAHQLDFLVLVDNCSNNSLEIIKLIEEFSVETSSIEIVSKMLDTNVGLGAAQNIGISVSDKLGASHVLLLDQDSVLQADFVKELLNAERSLIGDGYKVGAIGGTYYDKNTGEVYPITKYVGPFISRILPDDKPVEATFIIASGSLIRLEVLKIVGMMKGEFFIDYIDVEWAFRAKSKGFKLYASPTAKMAHDIGDQRSSVFGRSISVHSPLRRYYLYRNSVYMIADGNVSVGYKIREIVFNLARLFVFMFLAKEKVRYLKYSLSGYWDGLRGVKGKCSRSF